MFVGLDDNDQVVGSRCLGFWRQQAGLGQDLFVGLGSHDHARIQDARQFGQRALQLHENHRVVVRSGSNLRFCYRHRHSQDLTTRAACWPLDTKRVGCLSRCPMSIRQGILANNDTAHGQSENNQLKIACCIICASLTGSMSNDAQDSRITIESIPQAWDHVNCLFSHSAPGDSFVAGAPRSDRRRICRQVGTILRYLRYSSINSP